MVLITHDWGRFRQYAENCKVGSYQTKTVVEGLEVKVKAGRFGYIAVFENQKSRSEDQNRILNEILRFCEIQGFIEVEGSISDELFF